MDKLVAFKFNGKHPSAERNMRHNVMFKVEETGNKNVADTVKKHSKTSSEWWYSDRQIIDLFY